MERTLAKSRWIRLIPVIFITYSLAYLDRANFGFAAAGKMAEDLNITPAMSSLLGSLFFLGYFFFQIPGAHYASKKSAKKINLLVANIMGRLRHRNRYDLQCKSADLYSFYPWCCGKCSISSYAYFIKQVVYKIRAFTCQHIFNSWQPGNYPMDVYLVWLFDKCTWLEMDVYPGRLTCYYLGFFLVAPG